MMRGRKAPFFFTFKNCMRRLLVLTFLLIAAAGVYLIATGKVNLNEFQKNAQQELTPSSPPGDAPVSSSEQERIDRAIEAARQMAEADQGAVAQGKVALSSAGSEAPPAAAQPALAVQADKAPAPPQIVSLDQKKEVLAAVNAWAAAWSSRNVDQYLTYYAPDFDVPNNLSRAKWEAQRRQRISSQNNVNVAISEVQIDNNANTVSVRFTQHYKSDKLDETSKKTLVLDHQSGRWMIVQEVSGR